MSDAQLEAGAEDITIFARAVASAAPSFADELLRQLRGRGVRKIHVVGSPDRLYSYLLAAAERAGDVAVERSTSDARAAS